MTERQAPGAGGRTESVRAVEAILMVTTDPAPAHLLAQLVELPVDTVEQLCRELAEAYEEAGHGFQLVEVAGGWRFQTHPDLAPYVERFAMDGQSTRLSSAALETLAIVAYKQPISRAQVSAIRGVNVDAVLRTLEQRGYVEEVGRDTGPGQAVLFGTTSFFLERVGLNAPDELPALGDFVPAAEVVEALEQSLKVEVELDVEAPEAADAGEGAAEASEAPEAADAGEGAAEASEESEAAEVALSAESIEDPEAADAGDPAVEASEAAEPADGGEPAEEGGPAAGPSAPDDDAGTGPVDAPDVVIDLRDQPAPAASAGGEERVLTAPGGVGPATAGPEPGMVRSPRRSPVGAAERQESVQQPGRDRDDTGTSATSEADSGSPGVVVDLREATHRPVAPVDGAVDGGQAVGPPPDGTLEAEATAVAVDGPRSGPSDVDDA